MSAQAVDEVGSGCFSVGLALVVPKDESEVGEKEHGVGLHFWELEPCRTCIFPDFA